MIEMGAFEWFEENAEAHFSKHKVRFDAVVDFNMASALIVLDGRRDYGQPRVKAVGFIKERLHVLVYTETRPGRFRVISLRKANDREKHRYQAGGG